MNGIYSYKINESKFSIDWSVCQCMFNVYLQFVYYLYTREQNDLSVRQRWKLHKLSVHKRHRFLWCWMSVNETSVKRKKKKTFIHHFHSIYSGVFCVQTICLRWTETKQLLKTNVLFCSYLSLFLHFCHTKRSFSITRYTKCV